MVALKRGKLVGSRLQKEVRKKRWRWREGFILGGRVLVFGCVFHGKQDAFSGSDLSNAFIE